MLLLRFVQGAVTKLLDICGCSTRSRSRAAATIDNCSRYSNAPHGIYLVPVDAGRG